MPQLEAPTTRMCSYVLGGFGEKKQKKKTRIDQVRPEQPEIGGSGERVDTEGENTKG